MGGGIEERGVFRKQIAAGVCALLEESEGAEMAPGRGVDRGGAFVSPSAWFLTCAGNRVCGTWLGCFCVGR